MNALVVLLVASPLLLLEWLRSRSSWIDRNHGELSLGLWLITLFAIYVWVLPRLGIRPNARVLYP